MTYVPRPGVWRTTLSDGGVELNLDGDENEAAPENVQMARVLEPQLQTIISDAVDFVSKHVVKVHGISGDPDLQWIDCGLSNYGDHHELEFYFSDAATYVLWAVRFRFNCDLERPHFTPVGYSCRAW